MPGSPSPLIAIQTALSDYLNQQLTDEQYVLLSEVFAEANDPHSATWLTAAWIWSVIFNDYTLSVLAARIATLTG